MTESASSGRLRPVRRWLVRGGLTLAVLAALLFLYVVGVSEWLLRRSHDAPLDSLPALAVDDPAEGERLAVIVGCWAGCHGIRGEGDTLRGGPAFQITAPTLSQVVPEYSDSELVRLIRYGVKRDGRSAAGMIARTFYPLSDRDLALIIAHLRRAPASTPMERTRRITLIGRAALATGQWRLSADEVDRSRARWGEQPRLTPFEDGRYLASITCSECHGLDYTGNEFEGGPSLLLVARYDFAQFRHLLGTGEPIGGRDLGIMTWVARNAFHRFTEDEMWSIYEFLRTRFELPVAKDP
jgi:mono/diheme cytochrome c family protein